MEAVLQMRRSIFCLTDIDDRHSRENQILQYVNTDHIILLYNNSRGFVWGQHETIFVFLTGTVFAGTFCTHLENGDQTSACYVIPRYFKVSVTSTASPPIHSGPSNWPLVQISMRSSFVLHTFSSRKFSLHHTEIIETVFS